MAGSPNWKVYSGENEYVAACRYIEDAAAVVALYDHGTIRDGHRKRVWTEGVDGDASESYDAVAEVVTQRTSGAFAVVR